MVCDLVWLQEWILERYVFNRDWTVCLIYNNHYWLNIQHNQGDMYDHLMSKKIFTSIANMVFVYAPKNCEESGYGLNFNLLNILFQSHVSYPRRGKKWARQEN